TEKCLVGLEMLERGIARQGHGVHMGGAEVGRVTSGTFCPTLEKAMAMAYVSSKAAQIGTDLEVEVRKKRLAARVVSLPFYRRPR
ncbi:MAG: glycine cleavage system aminomethyltransferase GcvT, partial [Acidobacteriota bacterium]|nr:glycine cleavage system aminomethyltransferase GcvT [Acidobacteriota bacterium]